MSFPLRICEFVLRLAASLSLAVITISSIAALLAIATWYESYYGSAAAKLVVYESPLFYAVLFGLALNVAAAVIARYPWKRKHTGFIVTHIGIEVLLLGCLLDIRLSQEGRVAMRPGQRVDVIDSTRDGLFVTWQTAGRPRGEVVAMDCWPDAGYPSLSRFLLSPVLGLKQPGWPAGYVARREIAPGVAVELLDWAAAAKTKNRIEPAPGENPAAELRLSGRTPAGANVDERLILHNPDESGATGALFGGVIEATLRRSRVPEEAKRFLEPVNVAALGTSGRLQIFLDNAWHEIDVADQLGKPVAIADSSIIATVEGYFPAARWDGQKLTSTGDAPTDPMVKIVFRRGGLPALPLEMVASARYPSLTGPIATAPAGFGPLPVVMYDHPAILRTDPKGLRGRLELLACDDGRLLYRRCGLRGIEASGEIARGMPLSAWMGLNLELMQYEPAGHVVAGFTSADVAAKDLSDGMRAARVALIVDDTRREFSIARGGGDQTFTTPRGEVNLHYGFDAIDLPASLTLKSARMTRDPGTDRAANWESTVEVIAGNAAPATSTITMNEPLTVGGRTFYQAGFDETGGGAPAGGPVTVLSMRYDPGRPVKYAGCGFIVMGIFLMFYMKSYFQRSVAAIQPLPRESLGVTLASPRLTMGRDA